MTTPAPVSRVKTTFQILNAKKKRLFLALFARTGNKLKAAQGAGYPDTSPINKALKNDPEFAAQYAEAEKAAADALEAELLRRGVEGVLDPVYHKGEVVGHKIVYSDTLLALAVKAANRDKYGDRSKTDVNVSGTIGHALLPTTHLSVDEWEKQSQQIHEKQKTLALPDPNKSPQRPIVDVPFEPVKTVDEQLADIL